MEEYEDEELMEINSECYSKDFDEFNPYEDDFEDDSDEEAARMFDY